MPFRRIGQTELTVPPLGFGAAHLGNLYFAVPEAQAQATLQAAWTAGVRLYDTAPWYGRGLSEHRLGGFQSNGKGF
ncbi:MAG: aldo/keto reductase [Candidatus Saccharibacteria bacterium]|nr:aldo/keto reductase [Pseudorhodobacter sp.]